MSSRWSPSPRPARGRRSEEASGRRWSPRPPCSPSDPHRPTRPSTWLRSPWRSPVRMPPRSPPMPPPIRYLEHRRRVDGHLQRPRHPLQPCAPRHRPVDDLLAHLRHHLGRPTLSRRQPERCRLPDHRHHHLDGRLGGSGRFGRCPAQPHHPGSDLPRGGPDRVRQQLRNWSLHGRHHRTHPFHLHHTHRPPARAGPAGYGSRRPPTSAVRGRSASASPWCSCAQPWPARSSSRRPRR